MKLIDLDPRWAGDGGTRHGIGLTFDCPCGCDDTVYVRLRNPIDGGPRMGPEHPSWQRTGESFETLTLEPSILRVGGCNWHGWVRNGEIMNA